MKYVCKICGFIYDEATQDAKWNDLDTDWVCPVCKAPKEKFEAVAETVLVNMREQKLKRI